MRRTNFKNVFPTTCMTAILLSFYSSVFANDRVVVIPLGATQSGLSECNECDDTFINENQSDSITSSMIVDGQVGANDIATDQVQTRVDTTCLAGSSIRIINSDGSVVCESFSDSGGDITGVTTGNGLTGGGESGNITINTDSTYLQRRISSSCAAGNSIRAILEDGTVTCEADSDSGDITGITAGTGLTGGGDSGSVIINTDSTYLQRRISSSCTTGSSIRAISEDGTVSCETDSDSGGDITAVTVSTGLSGGGSSGPVTVSAAIPFTLSGSVGSGVISGSNSLSDSVNPGYGVFGRASGWYGTGVYGIATSSDGIGVQAESAYGHALYAETTSDSANHAGYFTTSAGSGTAGSTVYARNDNLNGIAFWAHNDHASSTDAAVVVTNDGVGPLLKAFGGNGGGEEFKFENDGSLHIADPSIDDDVFHLEAARGLLTLGSGSSTTPGDDGDLWITNPSGVNTITLDGNGGSIAVYNGSAKQTILIDPQESADITTAGGQITLFDPDGTASVEIDGDYGGHGNIRLYNNDHNLRVNLDGSDGYVADFYGNVRIRDTTGTTVMELGAGLDYAEGFNVSSKEQILSGSVLIIDPDNPGQLKLSETAYDTKVAGIVAGANGLGSGVRLGTDEFDKDVALAGRVYCNVDTSRMGIDTGDLLTTSSIPGYAMKANDYSRAQGAILGKAMEPIAKGQKGQILVLVTLQ